MNHLYKIVLFFLILVQLSCKKTNDKIPPLPKDSESTLPIRIKYLKNKLEENPNNDFIFYLLAKDYLKQGKIDEALLQIRKAIAIQSKKKYLITLSECFYKKSQYLDAFDVLNQLDINDLSDMEFTSKAIDIFLQAKNFDKAKELINNKLAKDSLNADLLFKKAEIYLVAKDTNAAILYCEKSIKVDSSFKPAIDKLSVLFYQNKAYVKAINIASKSLILDSNSIETNYIKANSLFLLGEKDKSMLYFSKILFQDSTNIEALQQLADYKLAKKNHRTAYFLYKKLESLQPNSKNLDYNLATTLLYSGRHQEALAYYLKVDSTSKFNKNTGFMIKKIKQKLKNKTVNSE